MTFSWSGTDADSDSLSYLVEYSDDGGSTYKTIAVDYASSSLTVDRASLAGSGSARIKVTVSDGTRSASTESPVFTVAANSPEVFIRSPADNAILLGPKPLILEATAHDPEDGRLGSSSIRWSSSINGVLGTGGSLVVSTADLTAGTHELTATVTDSSGASGSASVTWSGGVKAPPPKPPAGLKASGGNASIDLSWDNPTDTTITGYRYRTKTGTGSYGTWQTIATSSASTTSHTITGLTATGTGYDIELQASSAAGWSLAARATAVTGPANSPTGLTATGSNAAVTLIWDAPPSRYAITMHRYRHKTADSESWSAWTELSATTRTVTISSLTNGTSYRIELAAKTDAGWSATVHASATPAAATPTVPTTPAPAATAAPSAPTGLKASGGHGSIDLSWTDPGDATITGYRYRTKTGTGGYGTWQTIATTNGHAVTGLTVTGASYDIELQAGNSAGWSPAVRAAATTGLAQSPTGVAVTPRNSAVDLSWDPPPARYGIIRHQHRYKKTSSSSWSSWTRAPATATSAAITGLTNDTGYDIELAAVSALGTSAPIRTTATPTLAAPAAPAGLTATPAASSITLTWNNPNNATITQYQYRERPSYDNNWWCWSGIWNSGAATTAATVPKLVAGTTHRIQVRAVNAAGPGPATEITATTAAGSSGTAPNAPTGLTSTGANQSINLTWNNPNNATITQYQFRERSDYSTDWHCWRRMYNSTSATTATTIPGITNNVRYRVQLRAHNPHGAGPTAETSATPTAPPAAPTGLTATPAASSITLTWNNPNNATITQYQYRERPSYDNNWWCWSGIWNSGAATTAATVPKLVAGTTHRIQVRAVNAAGPGPATEITATTAAGSSGTAPNAPTGLTSTGANQSINLTWNNPNNATITQYQFRERSDYSTDWHCWRRMYNSTSATTATTIPGITNNVRYRVQLRAHNPHGAGPTAETSATPTAPTTP